MTHCWKDKREWIEEEHGSLSPEMMADLFQNTATCMLEDGHAGPHEWTPDNDITITFAQSAAGESKE